MALSARLQQAELERLDNQRALAEADEALSAWRLTVQRRQRAIEADTARRAEGGRGAVVELVQAREELAWASRENRALRELLEQRRFEALPGQESSQQKRIQGEVVTHLQQRVKQLEDELEIQLKRSGPSCDDLRGMSQRLSPNENLRTIEHQIASCNRAARAIVHTLASSDMDAAAKSASASSLRRIAEECQQLAITTEHGLEAVLVAGAKTSRAGYLRVLSEQIQPPADDQHWRDEWEARVTEHSQIIYGDSFVWNPDRDAIDLHLVKYHRMIDDCVQQGWVREQAEVFILHSVTSKSMARALRERDSCYAASTFAMYDAFIAQAMRQAERREVERKVEEASSSPPARYQKKLSIGHMNSASRLPPRLYKNLHRPAQFNASLEADDPGWSHILEPDATGFRGLTSSALTFATCDPACFSEAGFQIAGYRAEGATYTLVPSDVVCFVSEEPSNDGVLREAVMTSATGGVFPPNCLFKLREVVEAGEWEAPGGNYPRQRLLVVSANYRLAGTAQATGDGGSKMCGSVLTLDYANRDAFIRGLDDLMTKPLLTMAQEFSRERSWRDWKGVTYSLREEWAYVTGPAASKEGCTPGTRDAGNAGKAPEDFLAQVNASSHRLHANQHHPLHHYAYPYSHRHP